MRDEVSGWQDEPDAREQLRLDVVGLACEVATLSARIAEAVEDSADPRAIEAGARRERLASRALALLAPQTDFSVLSDAALEHALALLQGDQQEMLELREAVERILASWSTL